MGKILKFEREGDQISMTVQLESGHKERWTYVQEDGAIVQINKEDLRK